MSHCTCDYHQEQNKKRQLGGECCVCFGEKAFDDGIVHCDCKCHKSSEEKKDWEEFDERFVSKDVTGSECWSLSGRAVWQVKDFIREKLKEEREKAYEEGKKKGSECIFCDYGETAKKEIIARAKFEERKKWQLKNAGLYRQLFGEMNPERTFTAKELWKMFDEHTPLFTEEQKKDLSNSIMK